MAASTINTECKRYGCMKNLLACFANCRYVGRCDELRNELNDKTAQAESDINRYLSERGRQPILVQILKRGVKFDDKAGRVPRQSLTRVAPRTVIAKPAFAPPAKVRPKIKIKTKPRPVRRPSLLATNQMPGEPAIALPVTSVATASRAVLRLASVAPRQKVESRSRKRSKMPRRVKSEQKAKATGSQTTAAPFHETPASAAKSEPASRLASKRVAPRKQTAAKPRKGGAGKVYIIIEGQTASIVDEQGLMAHLFGNHSKNARYFEASEVEARLQIVLKR